MAVIAAVVSAPVGDASAANRHLKKARKAHNALRYDDVLPLLKKALRVSKIDKEKVEIYVMMAEMHIAYNREVLARKAYVEVLNIQPDFELSEESSPKLLTVLQDARAQLGLLIGGNSPGGDQSVVSSHDPEERTGEFVDGAPPDQGHGATGDGGAGTGEQSESGSGATTPPDLMLTASSGGSPAIYTQWWFWTAIGIGAVVVGGSVAAYIATRSPQPPDGDFGTYRLP